MRIVQPTAAQIRAANSRRIVDAVRRHGMATRAQLVEWTGLSRATVSSVVVDLQAGGVLVERVMPYGDAHERGRPARGLVLDRSAGVALAVDVGVAHVAVSVGGLSHEPLAEVWVDKESQDRSGAASVLACVTETLRRADLDFDHLIGAVISVAGSLRPGSARLAHPAVLPELNIGELISGLRAVRDMPILVENDANLGALAESRRSTTRDGVTLYVKYASRIGLGIAVNGEIYRGGRGKAGELGHVLVDPGGERCWCGRRGCLEIASGGAGIARSLGWDEGGGSLGEIIARALSGDSDVRQAVGRAADRLGSALADAALLLDPTRVVIGGDLADLGDLVLDPVNRQLASVPFGAPLAATLSPLRNRASLAGAIALAMSDSCGEPARP